MAFTIDDLSNFIELSGSIGGVNKNTRQEKQVVQKDVFDDFQTKINSTFDNDLILRELDRMESYKSQNQDNMSDAMWDKYNYIKDKSKYNMEDNSYFNVHSNKINQDAQEFYELMEGFNTANQEGKDATVGTSNKATKLCKR